ncbi:hypothetical protein, partial [Lyngbya sp. CCY1209]|uniref:hypothetical protein n=1 Tax=Lyngbya sp. CCY1209 TaxID=2886103 RepID=UPI002D207D1C
LLSARQSNRLGLESPVAVFAGIGYFPVQIKNCIGAISDELLRTQRKTRTVAGGGLTQGKHFQN